MSSGYQRIYADMKAVVPTNQWCEPCNRDIRSLDLKAHRNGKAHRKCQELFDQKDKDRKAQEKAGKDKEAGEKLGIADNVDEHVFADQENGAGNVDVKAAAAGDGKGWDDWGEPVAAKQVKQRGGNHSNIECRRCHESKFSILVGTFVS